MVDPAPATAAIRIKTAANLRIAFPVHSSERSDAIGLSQDHAAKWVSGPARMSYSCVGWMKGNQILRDNGGKLSYESRPQKDQTRPQRPSSGSAKAGKPAFGIFGKSEALSMFRGNGTSLARPILRRS